jgi:serine/threonine protein kinase
VQCLHEEGVMHRDIKPANVFFAADGTPKLGFYFLFVYLFFIYLYLGDLGISRVILGDKQASTTNLGTLFYFFVLDILYFRGYMAPEILKNEEFEFNFV